MKVEEPYWLPDRCIHCKHFTDDGMQTVWGVIFALSAIENGDQEHLDMVKEKGFYRQALECLEGIVNGDSRLTAHKAFGINRKSTGTAHTRQNAACRVREARKECSSIEEACELLANTYEISPDTIRKDYQKYCSKCKV